MSGRFPANPISGPSDLRLKRFGVLGADDDLAKLPVLKPDAHATQCRRREYCSMTTGQQKEQRPRPRPVADMWCCARPGPGAGLLSVTSTGDPASPHGSHVYKRSGIPSAASPPRMRSTPRCRAASGGLPGNSRRRPLLPSTAAPDLRTRGQTRVEARAARLRGAVAGEMRMATPGAAPVASDHGLNGASFLCR
jgi:hypothetical protein